MDWFVDEIPQLARQTTEMRRKVGECRHGLWRCKRPVAPAGANGLSGASRAVAAIAYYLMLF
jgi:hypothetical protein